MSTESLDVGDAPSSDESIRVLHVDDEPGLADLAADFLERQNERFDVVTETHPHDALERVEETALDCVVTDYDMPELDGIDVIRRVREAHGDLPCIIYTGQGSEEVASDAIAAGATDYLQKQQGSEQYELLANRIVNAVESYRAERRAETLQRIRNVVREVNQTLVRETSREAIESQVCEVFADAETYRAAWIGGPDETGDRIEPRTSAGIDDEYFSSFELSVDADGPGGQGPAGTAYREGRLAVVDDVTDDAGDDLFRDVALEYDVRGIAAIPLRYGDSHYGILVVLSDRAGTFNDSERQLLEELGGDVAHAIDAVETREALQAERDRRAALFENAPNPIAEVGLEDGKPLLRTINDAFVDVFGFDADEVEGEAVTDVLVPEDEMDSHQDIMEEVAQGEAVETEVRRRTDDGIRDFLFTVSPAEVDNTAGYGWYIDITERKELEAELKEKANLLDHIFGQIPTALYVKDTEGRHVRLSDYDMDPDEALGRTDPEIYGESEFTRETYEDDMRVIEEGERIINKEEYNPENGEWTLTSKVPWYDDEGNIQGLIGVSRLITEKKEYERELERTNERLENFASVVSHDLRNPLTVAAGQVESLQADVDDERLERADKALGRMYDLIEDLLTMARQGEVVDELEPVSLPTAADRAWSSVDSAEATLDVAVDGEVLADEGRLLEVLENLFGNSVTHGGDDVTVRLGSLPDGFYVADDGAGIPADAREDIFDPGFTTSEEGTGFGLAIVDDIVDAHGWDLSVTESESGGARFEITGVETPR